MEVVFLINDTTYTYNLRREIIERLRNEGNQIYVVCRYLDFKQQLEEIGCKLIEVKYDRHGKNPFADIWLLVQYLWILKKIRPNVILTYNIKPNIYGGLASRILKIKYISNITGLGIAVEKNSFLQYILLKMYSVAISSAKCIFFQNDENRKYFEDKKIISSKNRWVQLPGSGVNLENFQLLPYPNDREIHFAFISRIMKEKGIDQYLEAADEIKEKYLNTVFHVCGSCEEDYQGKLKEMEEKGIIIYHGMLEDVREILKICHCTVHPSYYPEGMSNVLLESCACGRPIITTDRSGCREVVVDGENGYMIPQKNYEALVQSLIRFIKLPYEKKKTMGLAGRRKVEKEFDRNIVVNAYLKELASL